MRIVFCDDNRQITDELTRLVAEFFRSIGAPEPELAVYDSGEAMLAGETRADIAFLDVEMPGMSGISAGDELKKRNPYIKIFIVTSYPDYLDEAMRSQVFRFLTKPVDRDRLFRNLRDAVSQISLASREFAILTAEGVYTRRAEEIVCVEAAGRKVTVNTTDGAFTSSETLDHWRSTLTLPCFFATHRSYIVNMRYVYSIEHDSVLLNFAGTRKEVYLSRRRYSRFKDAYLMYLESVK